MGRPQPTNHRRIELGSRYPLVLSTLQGKKIARKSGEVGEPTDNHTAEDKVEFMSEGSRLFQIVHLERHIREYEIGPNRTEIDAKDLRLGMFIRVVDGSDSDSSSHVQDPIDWLFFGDRSRIELAVKHQVEQVCWRSR